jgi:hypothetical protein
VARSARYVVLVAAPTLEGVAHCQARMNSLGFLPGRAAVLTIGSRPYRPDEVGAALDVPVLGSIANDRRGAEELASGRVGRRSELLRSAATMAEGLASHLAPVVPEDVQPAAGWLPVAEARHEAAGWLPVSAPGQEAGKPSGPQRAQLWSPPRGNHAAPSRAALAHRAPPWQ